MTTVEGHDTALLLRSGRSPRRWRSSRSAPSAPSLDSPRTSPKGFNSVIYGFAAIAVFMIAYYAMLIGVFSTIALA